MKPKRPHDYKERVERFGQAIAQNGDNAAAHASLAQVHWEAGELETAIHHWRTAVRVSPQSPLTQGRKTQLKKALALQARAAQGLQGDGFADFKVCDRCDADVPKDARICPACQNILEMGFFEWITRRENALDVGRYAAPFIVVLWIVALIFAHLPLEYKACLMMAGVIVGAWYFLRAIGGNIVD